MHVTYKNLQDRCMRDVIKIMKTAYFTGKMCKLRFSFRLDTQEIELTLEVE